MLVQLKVYVGARVHLSQDVFAPEPVLPEIAEYVKHAVDINAVEPRIGEHFHAVALCRRNGPVENEKPSHGVHAYVFKVGGAPGNLQVAAHIPGMKAFKPGTFNPAVEVESQFRRDTECVGDAVGIYGIQRREIAPEQLVEIDIVGLEVGLNVDVAATSEKIAEHVFEKTVEAEIALAYFAAEITDGEIVVVEYERSVETIKGETFAFQDEAHIAKCYLSMGVEAILPAPFVEVAYPAAAFEVQRGLAESGFNPQCRSQVDQCVDIGPAFDIEFHQRIGEIANG